MEELTEEIKWVLIHFIGDHRECPACHKSNIINDELQERAIALFGKIGKELEA